MFKGEKVTLRAGKAEDLPRIYAFSQDVELAGLNCARPEVISWEAMKARVEGWDSAKEDSSRVFFAIEADGKYIGNCALVGLDDRNGSAELGITIGDREYWGRGYGRDALRVLLHFAFHYLGLRRIVLTTHVKNQRAVRCYRACGFVEEGHPRKAVWVEGEYVDLVNMGILREEWLDTPGAGE